MIEHSPTIAALCTALHGVQGSLTGVAKDSKNPHFKNRYASLEAVMDTARPALQQHGLCVSQAPGALTDGAVEITTMLMHTSGEWMRSTLHMPVVKRDPQGVGSAITYGLRYALMAVLGVPPTDDDDGERAVGDRSSAPSRSNGNGHASSDDTASRRIARDLCARLWKVQGEAAVKAVTDDPSFRQQFRVLEADDSARVGDLVRERRAIQ